MSPDEAGMEDAFQKIVSQLGVPHVLVNNAGILASLERVVDMSLESWCSTQVSFFHDSTMFYATNISLSQDPADRP